MTMAEQAAADSTPCREQMLRRHSVAHHNPVPQLADGRSSPGSQCEIIGNEARFFVTESHVIVLVVAGRIGLSSLTLIAYYKRIFL